MPDATDVIVPKGMEVYYDRMHFAPAVRDGDRLFCAGQLGIGPDGKISDDPDKQFAQAFDNVRAVLEEAGASFENVVEMTSYHVGLLEHMGPFMQVKDRYVREPYPAWTAIGISELAMAGALVEIRVIAHLP